MDKVQYHSIIDLVTDDDLIQSRKIEEINTILGVDIDNLSDAKTLKEKVLASNDTIVVTKGVDTVSVEFDGIETTAPSFGIAFIANLLNVLASRAIDKFLPEPAQAKEKSGTKRDGLGSPAPVRQLPIKGKNY
jgi:hypothetical protein